MGLIAYFKYSFFILHDVFYVESDINILLPIGISFFTFQQIAFLVDRYRGATVRQKFSQYVLFISFFPHLLSGPLVMQQNIIPQLCRERMRPKLDNLILGLSVFTLGLFKKTIIADNISPYVDTVFNAAQGGAAVSFLDAWLGSMGFGLQIYFDFSGYCDMAIGLALLFGVRFPINFYSPYKASSIIEFWRRWNITLSKFLRDYLYIPLGGNRQGKARRYVNLMIVMLLGGLWHGASWMFVLWGGLNGAYLIVNHGFQKLCTATGSTGFFNNGFWTVAFGIVTFAAVTVTWVPFRADSIGATFLILGAMTDIGGGAAELGAVLSGEGFSIDFGADRGNLAALLAGLLIVFALPNVAQVLELDRSDDNRAYFLFQPAPRAAIWRQKPVWGLALGMVLALAVLGLSATPQQFVYFQF